MKKCEDYGYYLIEGNLIHYYDNKKNYETTKILIK